MFRQINKHLYSLKCKVKCCHNQNLTILNIILMCKLVYSSKTAILPAVYRDGETFGERGDRVSFLSGHQGK